MARKTKGAQEGGNSSRYHSFTINTSFDPLAPPLLTILDRIYQLHRMINPTTARMAHSFHPHMLMIDIGCKRCKDGCFCDDSKSEL